MSQLFVLIENVHECGTKLHLMDLFINVIGRLEREVRYVHDVQHVHLKYELV